MEVNLLQVFRVRVRVTIPVCIVTVFLRLALAAGNAVIFFQPVRHTRRQSHTNAQGVQSSPYTPMVIAMGWGTSDVSKLE